MISSFGLLGPSILPVRLLSIGLATSLSLKKNIFAFFLDCHRRREGSLMYLPLIFLHLAFILSSVRYIIHHFFWIVSCGIAQAKLLVLVPFDRFFELFACHQITIPRTKFNTQCFNSMLKSQTLKFAITRHNISI